MSALQFVLLLHWFCKQWLNNTQRKHGIFKITCLCRFHCAKRACRSDYGKRNVTNQNVLRTITANTCTARYRNIHISFCGKGLAYMSATRFPIAHQINMLLRHDFCHNLLCLLKIKQQHNSKHFALNPYDSYIFDVHV